MIGVEWQYFFGTGNSKPKNADIKAIPSVMDANEFAFPKCHITIAMQIFTEKRKREFIPAKEDQYCFFSGSIRSRFRT